MIGGVGDKSLRFSPSPPNFLFIIIIIQLAYLNFSSKFFLRGWVGSIHGSVRRNRQSNMGTWNLKVQGNW
ncbi:hypothetical protein BDV30DRAFT_101889 [Aspergillus minisclerotigenes]|uniref:Uncharacterized protein n=1 Tax=Aspergillus minisclerotigenes TaxID=656917 RepID=A0A5N6JIX6_9EURO|nr:hypothetical protein BDV30DRAFT_101889 [Aspergillus minisclerotigenes]